MAKGSIEQRRSPIAQPDRADTRKSMKGYTQPEEYSAEAINKELDYLHERLNLVIVESDNLADLDPATATLPEVVEQQNLILATLRDAGLLRRS